MALASVLQAPLSVNQRGFFGLGGRADLSDLGPGSPSDGLSLAAPGCDVPEEPKIEMLHGTTTLAFKVRTAPGGVGGRTEPGQGRPLAGTAPSLWPETWRWGAVGEDTPPVAPTHENGGGPSRAEHDPGTALKFTPMTRRGGRA